MNKSNLKFRIKRALFTAGLIIFLLGSNIYAQEINLIPYPQEIEIGKHTFELNSSTRIACTISSYKNAEYLQNYLKQLLDNSPQIVELSNESSNVIKLIYKEDLDDEAYELTVSRKDIQIIASGNAGWFYGIQTLIQIISNSASKGATGVLEVKIKDSPGFSWRAFMLDEARHFKGKEQVKRLLDEMAHLKMNILHWHLTDDQGWRIEIKKYPKLTGVGAYRKSTRVNDGNRWESLIESGEPHGGFYTQEDIKEIVAYAQERHITIVPEIEMPGHATAAIAAYPWLGVAKGNLEVPSRFGVFEDLFNVTDPRVFQFFVDVLDEVIALFPSEVIHIGGDEVKYDQWKESAVIQEYMKENNLNTPAELQIFFTNRISQYIESKGKRMMGWNEIMGHNLHEYQEGEDTHNDIQLAKETVIHFWKGDISLATKAAKDGFEIVNSLHTHTYLDYTYETTPLSKAYSFNPIPEGLDEKYHKNIIGTGCQMWSEWIPTIGQLHYQVFPRIAAYAEVGWTENNNKDYKRFKSSLKYLQQRWDEKSIHYAPVSIVDGKKR